TIAWGLLSGAACLALVWRRPGLRVPVIGGYLVTAAAVGGFLAWTTLRDRVVHENVVAGVPMTVARHQGPKAVRENVQLASGRFTSLEHASHGTVAIVRLPGGEGRAPL